MLLSTTHNFIYIRVPKTASTSINRTLEPYANKRISHFVKYIFNQKNPIRYQAHTLGKTIRSVVGFKVWQKSFNFAFIRNPWDHVVSGLNYRMNTRLREPFKILKKITDKQERLSKFIQICLTHKNDNNFHLTPQTEWLVNTKKEIIVDFVGHFENLQTDFDHVCNSIHVEQTKLPLLNKCSSKSHYTEYYTNVTRKIVTELRQTDIEFGNYKFGG